VPVVDPSGKLDGSENPRLLGKARQIVLREAEIIRRLYERYVIGVGIGTIVEELNRSDGAAVSL